ncbi:hypothetical protein REPUB_Repub08aG0037700 [Reevesia pubescens]
MENPSNQKKLVESESESQSKTKEVEPVSCLTCLPPISKGSSSNKSKKKGGVLSSTTKAKSSKTKQPKEGNRQLDLNYTHSEYVLNFDDGRLDKQNHDLPNFLSRFASSQ